MPSELALSVDGQRLLELLVLSLPAAKPDNPRTFISYKDVHDILHLPLVRETYGESLKAQGLLSLAEWTFKTKKPGITGLVIDRSLLMPGKGYFDLFGKKEDDFAWWVGEIVKSKAFNWSPFVPLSNPTETPTAIDIGPPTGRMEITVSRIIRNTALAVRAKQLHNHECQICGQTILLTDGKRYAEAHHIQPLGEPHNGPDTLGNLLCVCPNHHAELDFGARSLALSDLRSAHGHTVAEAYMAYHNTHVWRKP